MSQQATSAGDGAGGVEPDLQRLAWTRHDGPGQPPAGPSRVAVGVLAGALLVGATGMFASDSLCPEHRAWVIGLGVVVLVGSFATGAAMLANRPMAAGLAVIPAVAGVVIGVIDAAHDATRGWIIAAVFAVAVLAAIGLALSGARAVRWRHTVAASLRPADDVAPQPGRPALGLADQDPGDWNPVDGERPETGDVPVERG